MKKLLNKTSEFQKHLLLIIFLNLILGMINVFLIIKLTSLLPNINAQSEEMAQNTRDDPSSVNLERLLIIDRIFDEENLPEDQSKLNIERLIILNDVFNNNQ